MAINWPNIEDALRTWVLTSTQYAQGRVIWQDQSGTRPAGDVIAMRITGVASLGGPDEITSQDSIGRPAGEEIELKVEGHREFVCQLSAYAANTTGANSGLAALSKCQAGVLLPSVQGIFDGVHIAAFDVGNVQNVTTLWDTVYESRALLEVRFYARDSVSEYTTFIEEVVADDYTGPPALGTRASIDI